MGKMTPPQTLPPTKSRRKRWTRDDCLFLERSGLLEGRYELIDGEIIDKMGQNRPHSLAISLVSAWLYLVFGPRRVTTQATIEVRQDERVTNRPEPDAAVLREEISVVPSGEDILLVVEVADTSQDDDFGFKVGLYARAGIPEYWVLDLSRQQLTTFRDLQNGEYQQHPHWRAEDTVAPLCAPNNPVLVGDLLG